MKKTLIVGIGIGICGLLTAEESNFIIKPFGELGGLYNQGIKSSHSYGNLMAHTGVNFELENGWSFGIGAIGGWNIWNSQRSNGGFGINGYGGIGDRGDVSEAYVHYKNSRLELSAGRFNTNFLKFDYIAGNIQGISAQVKVDRINYWGTFIDSILWTGTHKNTSSTLYGTNIISGYYPTSKSDILGNWGEIIAAGAGYNAEKIKGSAFVLFNTQVPANKLPGRSGVLFQAGADIQYHTNITQEWESSSILRGIFQLGNTAFIPGVSLSAKDAIAGLLWFDQSFSYRIFEFGAGLLGVMGSEKNGGIYTLSDPSRFYGKIINNPAPINNNIDNFTSPYFASYNFTGYLFGTIDLSKNRNLPLKIDAMLSFGTYTEYSIVADYTAWSSGNMKLNTGIGYVYSELNHINSNTSGVSSLILFGKFFY